MLEHPGETFTYNGATYQYPRINLVYWCGGNPFHHHQDLNRLLRAWRRPPMVIVQEQFWTATAKLADIVLPVTTMLERDDLSQSQRERFMVAMRQIIEPVGEARHDYDIFSDLARRTSRPGRSAIRQPRGPASSTGMSTSSAAARPVMSAPGPRPGNSARNGRSGSSPATIRAASIGFSPGMEPIPVAVPGAHGNACFSATVSSLAASSDKAPGPSLRGS